MTKQLNGLYIILSRGNIFHTWVIKFIFIIMDYLKNNMFIYFDCPNCFNGLNNMYHKISGCLLEFHIIIFLIWHVLLLFYLIESRRTNHGGTISNYNLK